MARAHQKVLFVRPRSAIVPSRQLSGSGPEPDISQVGIEGEDIPIRNAPKTSEDEEQDVGLQSKNSPGKHPLLTPLYRGGYKKVGSLDLGPDEKEQDADVLLAAVLRLPKSERKELLARLSLAESAKPGESRDVDMWIGAVYSALLDAVGADRGVGGGPLALKRVLGASSAWGPVLGLMESSGLMTLTVVRRQAVYNLFAGLLVDHARSTARRAGFPLSARFAATCAQNLPAIVDSAFPGYLRAGILPLVADRLTNRREEEDHEDHQ
jgi:hypothetical protein